MHVCPRSAFLGATLIRLILNSDLSEADACYRWGILVSFERDRS